MYSQSYRIFSQEGELSQLSSKGLCSQTCSNNNNNELNNEGAQSISQSRVSETNIQEEPFSSRADVICKENQQIGNLVVKTLKKCEKKRIKLIDSLAKVQETEKFDKDVHQRQSQQLLDLQMSLEKVSGQLRNNLDERPKLLIKLKNIQYLRDVFQENFSAGVNVKEELNKSEKYLRGGFEQCYNDRNKINKNKLKEEFDAEWVKFVKKSQNEVNAMFDERKKSVCEIQTLALQNEEDLNETKTVEVELNNETANYNAIIHRMNETTQQKKTLTEENKLFRQELDDARAITATLVQNINLHINTEQHNKSNLESKCEKNQDYLNSRSKKRKESMNLSNQIKTAVEETSQSNEALQKKTKYCQEQNNLLKNENDSFIEAMKQYENVEIENLSLKKDMPTIEGSIDVNRKEVEAKDEIVQNLISDVEDLKKQLYIIEDNFAQLDSKLIMTVKNKEELATKFKYDKLHNQQERENKIKQNKNVELAINSLSNEEENLTKSVNECDEFSYYLKLEEQELNELIKAVKEETEQNKTKLFNEENDFSQDVLNIDEITANDNEILDQYEELLIELKPEQDTLSLSLELNASLEQTLSDQEDKYREECRNLEQNFSFKIKELDKEMEKYCPIMDSLIAAEEEATGKLKEEIKETDDIKINLETNLRKLHENLQSIINVEQHKRSKIVKLEKRLKAIRKETVVTHQDIRDWGIMGKVQTPIQRPSSVHLMTPNSSVDSLRNLKNPPQRINYTTDFGFKPHYDNQQMKTRKWVESVPIDDEYEFTEM